VYRQIGCCRALNCSHSLADKSRARSPLKQAGKHFLAVATIVPYSVMAGSDEPTWRLVLSAEEVAARVAVRAVTGMSRPGTDNTSPLTPLAASRSDRAVGQVAGSWPGLPPGYGC
jgi:hypothetical protein